MDGSGVTRPGAPKRQWLGRPAFSTWRCWRCRPAAARLDIYDRIATLDSENRRIMEDIKQNRSSTSSR
jgi:hypothetical protein